MLTVAGGLQQSGWAGTTVMQLGTQLQAGAGPCHNPGSWRQVRLEELHASCIAHRSLAWPSAGDASQGAPDRAQEAGAGVVSQERSATSQDGCSNVMHNVSQNSGCMRQSGRCHHCPQYKSRFVGCMCHSGHCHHCPQYRSECIGCMHESGSAIAPSVIMLVAEAGPSIKQPTTTKS